jgi:hypothetical protein
MDVARLNMTHSDRDWHADVIQKIRRLNERGYNIAIMLDTEGSEAHLKAQDPTRVDVRFRNLRPCVQRDPSRSYFSWPCNKSQCMPSSKWN